METCSPEEWRRISNFPNYWISNRGRVRHNRKILKGGFSNITGYFTVTLANGDYSEGKYIARLVLEAFVGPCPPKMCARFRDGNKTNHNLTNLFWGRRIGVKHRRTTQEDIAETIRLLESGLSRKEVSKKQNITYAAVCYRLRRARLLSQADRPANI